MYYCRSLIFHYSLKNTNSLIHKIWVSKIMRRNTVNSESVQEMKGKTHHQLIIIFSNPIKGTC